MAVDVVGVVMGVVVVIEVSHSVLRVAMVASGMERVLIALVAAATARRSAPGSAT